MFKKKKGLRKMSWIGLNGMNKTKSQIRCHDFFKKLFVDKSVDDSRINRTITKKLIFFLTFLTNFLILSSVLLSHKPKDKQSTMFNG